jgi:hypothetical protein
VLDDVSPPEFSGGATAVEATTPPVVAMAEDEASCLQAQLEAIQEAMARSEWETATATTSHAKPQPQLLAKFLARFPVHPSKDVLS